MRSILLAATALAACSPPAAEGNETAVALPGNVAAATPVQSPAVSTAAAAPAGPGELKTFRDWIVGCDNGLRCTMTSLGPDMGDFPAMTMTLTRAPGPGGGYDIAIDALEDATPKPDAIVIDGRRFLVAADGLSGNAAALIAASLASAKLMAIKAGAQTIAISTAGASAALRYIDATQGRAGTVTATVAKGNQQPVSVPRAPALPVISSVSASEAPAAPTPAQLTQMRDTAKCEGMAVDRNDIFKPDAHALGDGKTLVMVPCSAGAYNLSSALFVLENGRVRPAPIDAPSGMNPDGRGMTEVVNGEWDDDVLKTYAKARGLGDCGVMQNFVWDGTRLRLIEQSEMGECRGNPNYITTWRAKVARK